MSGSSPRNPRPSGRVTAALILLPLLLGGCLFGLFQEEDPNAKEYRGYYSITLPGARDYLLLDSTYRIKWIATGAGEDGDVAISLHLGSGPGTAVDTVASSDGEYAWNIPSTVAASGYRLYPGPGYRIRITSLSDTSKWDWSGTYQIYSGYIGSLYFPGGGDSLYLLPGDTLSLRWSISGNLGDSLGVRALRYGKPVSGLFKIGSHANDFRWKPSDSLEAGGGYALQFFSLANPAIFQTRSNIRLLSGYEGTFSISAPNAYTVAKAGNSLNVAWTAKGVPARSVSLALSCDSSPPIPLGDSLPLSDSFYWPIPAGFPSSRDCRVRTTSEQDTSLSTQSAAFEISGILRDAFEMDDSLGGAKLLRADRMYQARTLTYRDQDWIRFETLPGKRYVVGARSKDTLKLALLGASGDTLASRADSIPRILFQPARAADYHLRVGPGAKTGSYSIFLAEYDSSSAGFPLTFFSPSSGENLQAGVSSTIRWTPDTLAFGSRVIINLYDGSTRFGDFTGSGTPNNGYLSVSAPSGWHTSSLFRYRITCPSDTGIHAYSPYFRVTGLQPDIYERDNKSSEARILLAGGTAQSHTMARNDTDWVQFDLAEGKAHALSLSANFTWKIDLHDSAGSVLESFSGRSASLPLADSTAGLRRIRIVPEAGAWGTYSLSLIATPR